LWAFRLVVLAGSDLAQGEDPLCAAFFFEKLLAGFEEVELGDESLETLRVGGVDDGERTEAEGGHPVGDASKDFVGGGDRR
jgi:hypothetical protein